LVGSDHLRIFLEAPQSEMQHVKTTQQGPGIASTITNFFGVKMVTVIAPAVEIDPWFETKTAYINTLESQLIQLANLITNSTIKINELGGIHSHMASISTALCKTEGSSDNELSKKYEGFAEVEGQIEPLCRELTNSVKTDFEDQVRDYIRILGSVKNMLGYRLERLAAYQDSTAAARAKKERFDKIKEGGAYTPTALENEMQRIEKQMETERDIFDAISKTCRSELEKFEESKNREIKEAVSQLIQVNIHYQLRVTDLWKTFLRNH
jgi:hypothetical protein